MHLACRMVILSRYESSETLYMILFALWLLSKCWTWGHQHYCDIMTRSKICRHSCYERKWMWMLQALLLTVVKSGSCSNCRNRANQCTKTSQSTLPQHTKTNTNTNTGWQEHSNWFNVLWHIPVYFVGFRWFGLSLTAKKLQVRNVM